MSAAYVCPVAEAERLRETVRWCVADAARRTVEATGADPAHIRVAVSPQMREVFRRGNVVERQRRALGIVVGAAIHATRKD